jgi:hypothetical protein
MEHHQMTTLAVQAWAQTSAGTLMSLGALWSDPEVVQVEGDPTEGDPTDGDQSGEGRQLEGAHWLQV